MTVKKIGAFDDIEACFLELEDELYKSVGHMVKIWSQIESWFAHILTALLMKSGVGREGETIYYNVQNLNPRINILEAAMFVRTDIEEPTKKLFAQLIEAIRKEATQRNQIIHGDFMRGSVSDSEIAAWISSKVFSDMRSQTNKKMDFSFEDVENHNARIEFLRFALWRFYSELPGVSDSKPPKSVSEYIDMWRTAKR